MSQLFRDPKVSLVPLLQLGRNLLAESEAIRLDAATLNPKLSTGSLFLGLFGVEGSRSLVALGRYLGVSGLQQRTNALRVNFSQWHSNVLSTLSGISTINSGRILKENSALLARRFARTKAYKRLDTQIVRSVAELESISLEDLVYTDDIPIIKRSRADGQLLDLSNMPLPRETRVLSDRHHLASILAEHLKVSHMLEGALDAYSLEGKDSNRQALASCRSALELLITEIAGETNWRLGLAKIGEGVRKKLVSDCYAFLSGYGSHPGGNPTKNDTAYGIRMTIAACLWLVEAKG